MFCMYLQEIDYIICILYNTGHIIHLSEYSSSKTNWQTKRPWIICSAELHVPTDLRWPLRISTIQPTSCMVVSFWGWKIHYLCSSVATKVDSASNDGNVYSQLAGSTCQIFLQEKLVQWKKIWSVRDVILL